MSTETTSAVTPRLELRAVVRRLIAGDAAPIVGLTLTLILILLYGPGVWYVRTPVAIVAIVGLLWRDALWMPRLWLVLVGVLAGSLYVQRLTLDNHQYLMAYWCLAIALSLGAVDRTRSLQQNARLLIGLTFAFAFAWKIASPTFVSGGFLEYELLADERFAGFTERVAGVSREALAANREAIRGLLAPMATATAAGLKTAPAVHLIAQGLTWYTLVVEGWIALAFLLPRPRWLHRNRDLPLLAFLFTIYSIATVIGFAYLLIAMGFVQAERRRWWIPCAYLAAAIIVQIFILPFGHIASVLGF